MTLIELKQKATTSELLLIEAVENALKDQPRVNARQLLRTAFDRAGHPVMDPTTGNYQMLKWVQSISKAIDEITL